MPTATLQSIARSRFLQAAHERIFYLRLRLALGGKIKPGFFDSYPRFYSTSEIGSAANRLNRRYEAVIEANRNIIEGKSVLDLASHDGRWSFAAYKAGATKVTGVEARERLVGEANQTLGSYGVPPSRFEFILGDAFEMLDRFTPGTFQTVFCFGFLYHTIHHMLLLAKISKLAPQHLILDTQIDPDPGCIIEVSDETIARESAGAIADHQDRVMIGSPSRLALDLMLNRTGFRDIRYYHWRRSGITNWTNLLDYYLGTRVSLVADH